MPDRILRDYTTSGKFDDLSAEAERLFIRLLTKADDFGRFHRDPKLVKSFCFPRAETLRANTVHAWLTELSDHRLVFSYTVRALDYLAIYNFRQRLKRDEKTKTITTKSKFPAPDGKPPDFLPDDGDWREPPTDSGNFPEVPGTGGNFLPYSESESESKSLQQRAEKAFAATDSKRKFKLPLPQRELAQRIEVVLSLQWVNDAGKWINRIKADPEKSARVIAEVESAAKENRIKTTPAQYAEQSWKEFRS